MAKNWNQLERLDQKSLKKLQQDREKQAVAQKSSDERKKFYIIGVSIVIAIVGIMLILQVINKRSEMKEYLEQREKLLVSSVIGLGGNIQTRSLGDWEPLSPGLKFSREQSFRTEKASFVTVELQLKNQLKLASNSEMVVYPPVLEEKENKIKREHSTLTKGEVTVAVGVDGREMLEVEAGGVVALGASGLFKVIYNPGKNSGEVVVKNGLVEVFSRENAGKKVKVSGFYKVTFSKGIFTSPSQASIIQYDWR